MARRGHDDDDDEVDEEEEEDAYDLDDDEDEDEEDDYEEETRRGKASRGGGGAKSGGGRKRSREDNFIDDSAIEDEDDEDDDGGGRPRKKGGGGVRGFFDEEAQVDEDEEEEDEGEGEDDFINDAGADLPDEDVVRGSRRHSIPMRDEEEDIDEMERQVRERYARSTHIEYGEEAAEVEQQALLPSVKDPKLWMVKCAIGHERETAICLMQKFIDRSDLQIKSVVALDHLKNYIYVEAEKEAHVKEACKGLRNIYASAKITLVPIKEMADVLSVESKSVDLSRDSWVRMKLGIYKGDLAKVVDVDNVRQRVDVKLIPRIDLQALASKLEGRDIVKKKAFVPPPRFFNIDEAREMHIRVERRRDKESGEYFEWVDNLKFKDGFLYKSVSTKSIHKSNIQPTFDELEKFKKPGDDMNGDMASLSTLFANRKKGHFMKGDAVIVIKGDLKNLEGWVEKVEDETVHIRPKISDLPKTLAFNEKELCKYFKPGDHVKVISGVQEGATGMVVKVEGHVLIILSDTTKEHIRVFADHVVESSEITTGITRIGDYELHDLVLLDNLSFGVIIRVEAEAFQVLKGVPDRPEVVLVKLREIKSKIERRSSAKDRSNNIISAKDVVRVVEGACKGKQGPVEHIHKGMLFIYDRHHLEHAGFICAKAQSCLLVGGSTGGRRGNGMDTADARLDALRSSASILQSPGRLPPRGPNMNYGGRFGGGRGGRGYDALVGKCIKIKSGPYKGYRGRVKEVTGALVRVELDSLMKIVTVKRDDIADTPTVATPFREPRYSLGGETPMHPSRTPHHAYQTPMRDPGATPIHDGMRTPMRSRAWAPMSPPRDNWEDGNPATWGSSPAYQPGTPQARPYEAPTPGSGWANTPGVSFNDAPTPRDNYANAPSPYVPSTPVGQPMTPNSASYLPGTPGGQPMTPGNAGMDMLSPIIGGDGEVAWLLPDVLVNVLRGGDDGPGVVREVLGDGSCRVALGSSGNGDVVTVLANEVEVIRPKKSDRIKILNGNFRGYTGKLIGIDGSDGIVRLDETYEVKILDMVILAKLAT
ncbi:putative transcription elongation factor SPT5 homolog 1 [Zea mays]|uniref:Transcription elongation factor SPT5 n=2 Tax=Zea mays TaxID=4577 RepID=K7W575_MAIZE|nr:putative transcription elongation factor SPT5 homolog 1 [Zea mays]AQL01211.1 Putative transcription elongation factor SPT5 homolog 1 [Zea mays]|eukprot:XP_008659135.1 putative transcription elongation factor SPT5 homolog 1 [Zea mays]